MTTISLRGIRMGMKARSLRSAIRWNNFSLVGVSGALAFFRLDFALGLYHQWKTETFLE